MHFAQIEVSFFVLFIFVDADNCTKRLRIDKNRYAYIKSAQ